MKKQVIDALRLREVPARFSWVDHRLVRDGYIERLDAWSAMLYLFLVTVSDRRGLSYYSETSIAKQLGCGLAVLSQSRNRLCQEQLIAYKKPLYQVLCLDPHKQRTCPQRQSDSCTTRPILSAAPQSAGQILIDLLKKGV